MSAKTHALFIDLRNEWGAFQKEAAEIAVRGDFGDEAEDLLYEMARVALLVHCGLADSQYNRHKLEEVLKESGSLAEFLKVARKE